MEIVIRWDIMWTLILLNIGYFWHIVYAKRKGGVSASYSDVFHRYKGDVSAFEQARDQRCNAI